MRDPSTKRNAPRHAHPHEDELPPGRPPQGLALDPPDDPPPAHPPEIPVDRLDQDAIRTIARLRHMGHKAYFVGGCVRDLLLDRTPKDFDVATDAHPGEVRAIFRNCRLIGRRFRLAHVYFRGGKVIEVATFRKNPIDVAEDVPDGGDLLITRDNVFGTAEEDAVRRDFTVNGLFYDVASGEVIDFVGGRRDLEDHRIATIGDPEIRMREDPVRTLRAIRFASRLGFTIEPDCFEAMRRHAGELARCAPARVLEETLKILRCGGSARAFELLRACGALPMILPALGAALDGWDDARRRSFFAHLAALDRLVRSGEEVSEAVLLGALLTHLGPEADALLASMVATSRLPRKIAERVRLALHGQRAAANPQRRRRRGRRGGGGAQDADAVQLLRITVEVSGDPPPPPRSAGQWKSGDEGREALARLTAARHAHAARPGEPAHEAHRHGGEAPRDEDLDARDEVEEPEDAEDLDEREEASGDSAEVSGDGIRTVTISGSAGGGSADPGGRAPRRRRGGRRRRRRSGGGGGGSGGSGGPSA